MKRIVTLFVFLSALFVSFSQQKKIVSLNYDNDSRWFWTLNAGAAWTTADVETDLDWGYGITIGKSYNYNNGSFLSFDIRGRYLGGSWYGKDVDSTNVGSYALLSTTPTDYKTNYGFAYLNHKTRTNDLSLELVIHLNNLRARTAWDVFVFGGVGYSWFQTKGNYLDVSDNIYLLNTTLPVAPALDPTYETTLDGTIGKAWNGNFMPSLGFGIGKQLGGRFSVGVEHRTTFTRLDNFDGIVNPQGNRANDLYHYTSAYLRFQIREYWEQQTDPEVVNNNNTNTNTTPVPPIVDFTSPSTSGLTMTNPNFVIKGKIQHVTTAANVAFSQNGMQVSNFMFNPSTQQFESSVTLNPGQNTFVLTGTNTVGADQETMIINYNRESNNPPIVTYSNPSSSPTTVSNPSFGLSGNVLNVTQSSQIQMTMNGQPITFGYNATNTVITANLNLQVGSNVITTSATNVYGSDQETTTLIYQPQQTVQPPVVYFVDPSVSPYTTANQTFTINADVLNVSSAQNIVFKQNGQANSNFTYNAQSHRLQSNVVLVAGQNVFEIIGTNAAGSAQASTIIIYERVAPKPPIVTITHPSTTPIETTNASFNLVATVLNVALSSQISMTLNGQNNVFVYTAANNILTSSLNLISGSNTVKITATNSDGTDSEQTIIIYRPSTVSLPPVVEFTNPSMDPFTTEQTNYTVAASVNNVSNSAGINVNVNGVNTTSFSFTNGIVSFNQVLIEGANVITITGTNLVGTDSETQTIIHRKPQVAPAPQVSFIDPGTNPYSVTVNNYLVKGRVRFVQNASQITLRINGQVTNSFTYSASSEIMEFTTSLIAGANIFEVTATNASGTDSKTTTIIYSQPNPTLPPTVTITNPIANPHSVSVNSCPILATVLNVDNALQIVVKINGNATTNYTYNPTTKIVSLTMPLNNGSNNLQIIATTPSGTAQDSRVIKFERIVVVTPPVVNFVAPSQSGTTVNVSSYQVKATVLNVTSASNIIVSQDGQVISSNLWTYNASTSEVVLNTNLNEGNNVFTVSGTNTGGTDVESTSIIYRKIVVPCDKPVINVTNPSNLNGQQTGALISFTAGITNITAASQVQLSLNGSLQGFGTFSNGVYTKELNLTLGTNVIELIATNACGVTKSVSSVLRLNDVPPCVAPTLTRVLPLSENFSTENAQTTCKVLLTGITQLSQITAMQNGMAITGTYEAATHTFSANVNLSLGLNTISVTGTNECGTASMNWNVMRTECVKPTVSVASTSIPNGGTTTNNELTLQLATNGVTAQSQIQVTVNGSAVSFVFNPQTQIVDLTQNLTIGVNSITVILTNTCGTGFLKFGVTRNPQVIQTPPTVAITNPATQISNSSTASMTISANVTGVTNHSQITASFNGNPVNFDYNSTSNTVTFNASFLSGANQISISANNNAGVATDNATVTYVPVVVVNVPVIQLLTPTACPGVLPAGVSLVTGTVTDISDPSQVVIIYNGAPVIVNSTFVNGVYNFSFSAVLRQGIVGSIEIIATNVSGTNTLSCSLTAQASSTEGNGQTITPNPGEGGERPKVDGGGNKQGGGKPAPVKPAPVKPTSKPMSVTAPAPVKPVVDSLKQEIRPMKKGGGK